MKTWVQIFSKHVNRRLWPEQLWPQHCGKQKQALWGLMVTNHLYIQGENLFQKNTERDGTGHPIPSSNPTHKHTLTYACMHFSPANQQNPSNPNPPRSTCITTSSRCSLLDNAPSYRACFPPEGLCVNCSLCLKQKCAHLLQVLTQTACSLKRHGRLQYFNTALTEPLAVLTTQSFLITFHLTH